MKLEMKGMRPLAILIIIVMFTISLVACQDESNCSTEIMDAIVIHSWAEAYYNALAEKCFSSAILLVDINFDGVPELFFVHWGSATNMWIFSGLSYQNGDVVNIEFYDEWSGMPSELSLLRNRQTGEQVWLAHGRFSSRAGVYQSWVYEFVDFSDLSQVRSKSVFEFDSEMILNEEHIYGIDSIYNLRLPNGEIIEVSLEEIEAQRELIFGDFETIEVQALSIHRTQAFTDYVDWQDRVLERSKLITFFNEWK